MRSFTVFLLFVYSFCGSTAQTLLAEFPPIAPKIKIDNLLLSHDKDGHTGVCYSTYSSIVVQVVGQDGNSIFQKELKDNSSMLVPQGVMDTGDAFEFVYFNDEFLDYIIVKAGKAAGSTASIQKLSPFEPKDKYFGNIVSNNELYCIGWNKGDRQLKIGRYMKGEGRFSMKSIPVTDEIADKLRKRTLAEGLAGEELFTSISNTTIPEPGMALDRRKLYLMEDGTLAITIEGENYAKCQTELVLIDWENSRVELREFGPPVASGNQNSTNSFIYNDRLALFQVDWNYLYLAIHDLDSTTILKEYNYSDEQKLELMCSRLFVEAEGNTGFASTKEFTKDQPDKVLRKLSKGKPFVYFEPTSDGNLAFTLGNYVEQKGGGGGFSGGTPGSTISTPGGSVYMPGTPGTFTSYGNSYKLSRYFFSILDKTTLDIEQGLSNNKSFLSKKIKQFVEEHIEGTNDRIFAALPEYQIVGVPGADYALIVSYIKKEGKIKLHKIAL